MGYKKYQHIERFGTPEVQGIEFGKCYIFPKIDGTNASVWMDGNIRAGSRKLELTKESDNAGFYNWVLDQDNIVGILEAHPTWRIFGEWLVPHSLKTYRDDAWRKFYIFDIVEQESLRYIPFDEYEPVLKYYNLNYISPISIINNPSYEQLVRQLDKNDYLIKDGSGVGEGIVIKNYDFKNKYGRTTWAKIVTSEFKEKHRKEMGGTQMNGKKIIEQEIAEKYITKALCDKVHANIENDGGFSRRQIPRLLNTIYHDLVVEESWHFVKEFKNPTINYKTLYHFVCIQIKNHLTELFS